MTAIVLGVVVALVAMLSVFLLVAERGRLLRPSTIALARTGGWRRTFSLTGLHGYVYGRWVRQYIGALFKYAFPRANATGGKWLSDRYHGKVLTDEHARSIITLDQEIPLRDLEQIVPYPVARNLVLQAPVDVVALDCPCRANRAAPCAPSRVCLVIGKPFTDFMLEHHPKATQRMTQQEALDLLQAEHERGHVHSAWFKDALLDRFYAICNCCKCCCGGIRAMTAYGVPMMAPSGFVARSDQALCTACAACADVCPFDAVEVNGRANIKWDACMGCGVCVARCPNEAMTLERDERKGVPLDVRLIARGAA